MSGKRYKKRQIVPAQQPNAPLHSVVGPAAIAARVQAEFFSGPLPPPSLLAKYNEVVPGGAERILAMAESQSKHRESLESKVVEGNIKSQQRGSLYAFVIAMTTITGGIYLIHTGNDLSGLATVITSLIGLVSVFAYAQYRQSKERTEKSKALSDHRQR